MILAGDVILRITHDGEVQITGWGWLIVLTICVAILSAGKWRD